MSHIDNTILVLPPAVSTAQWIKTVNLDNVKDSMMLTSLTFLLFGNSMAENVRTQSNVVTSYSDLMVDANSLMGDLNLLLGDTVVTESKEGAVRTFPSLADAEAYCRRMVAAGGGEEKLYGTYKGVTHLGIDTTGVTAPNTHRVYAYRTGATNTNDNLQLSISNYSSLSQQAQLVMNQGNTRMGSAMDYVTAGIEKWGKLLQSFIDGMRR